MACSRAEVDGMRHGRGKAILLVAWILVQAGGRLPAGTPALDPAALARALRLSLARGRAEEAEESLARLLALRGETPGVLVFLGRVRLLRGDPVAARHAFFQALRKVKDHPGALKGLARCELLLQDPERALSLARRASALDPGDGEASALEVRALLDLGRPEKALARAEAALESFRGDPPPSLLEARGAALFRCGHVEESALSYEEALLRKPNLAEAHIRLGTGLRPAAGPVPPPALVPGIAAFRKGDLGRAEALFRKSWRAAPSNPVCHRLLGEVLLERSRRRCFLFHHPIYRKLRSLLADPGPGRLPLEKLFPGYHGLSPERKAVVNRVARAWARYIPRLAALGARHDLLSLTESATLAADRAFLRGKRTADGRFWDEVRGVGGFHAATGVESLDEAASFGFDTLAHEVTHQVHLFAMSAAERREVERLYETARREGRCLDYYAATCPEEYLAQGFEAFLSLAKMPGEKRTHGHTRFELVRLDPGLDRFLRRHTAWTPLYGPRRAALLEASAEWALLAGRFDDALTAVAMMGSRMTEHARDLRDRALAEKGLTRNL